MTRALRLTIRIVLLLLAVAVLATAGGLAYVFLFLPHAATPRALHVQGTPEQIARGAYLSHHVVGCTDCHGERDWSKYSAPQMRSREGQGGMTFRLDIGTLYAPNITPVRLGSWTDGEILRAMTEGVSKEGAPLFPLMPYENYREMALEDAEAIIAYIRTVPAVSREVPSSELRFPMNIIVRTIPRPASLVERRPDPAVDRVRYGQYLTTIASCASCHTRMVRGRPVAGMAFAGGLEFHMRSGGVQYSANITPDPDTGIGAWSETQFIERFKMVAGLNESALVLNGRRNTEMPWRDYGGMTRDDLGAIYAYLRTIPPVRNAVPRS